MSLPWLLMLQCALASVAHSRDATTLDPSDSTLARPALDPAADAEIVDWRVRVVDNRTAQGFERMIEQHRATMVYTARGAESEGITSIAFDDHTTIEYVRIVVTGPDGTRRVIRSEQGFDRIVTRRGRWASGERKFALPGVVPGSLVELDARVRTLDLRYIRDFQFVITSDVGVRRMELRMHPWRDVKCDLRFNRPELRVGTLTTDPQGYVRMELRDVPAVIDEPAMTPWFEQFSVVWAHYGDEGVAERYSRFLQPYVRMQPLESTLPVTLELRERATAIVREATTPAEKLARLHEYCRRHVGRLEDSTETTGRSRSSGVDDRPATTLKNGFSDRDGINLLFTGLARSLGVDVRLGFVVHPVMERLRMRAESVCDHTVVLSPSNGGWAAYDPGSGTTAPGLSTDEDEGSPVIMVGRGAMDEGRLGFAGPDRSVLERLAEFSIDENGDLEGTVRVRATGHECASMRKRLRTDGRASVAVALAAEWTKALPTAELGAIEFAEDTLSGAGLRWQYTLRAPGYAALVDRRGVVRASPLPDDPWLGVVGEYRRQGVRWDYGRTCRDTVLLRLPPGATARLPSAPRPVEFPGVFGAEGTLSTPTSARLLLTNTRRYSSGPAARVPVSRAGELRRALAIAAEQSGVAVEVELARASSR